MTPRVAFELGVAAARRLIKRDIAEMAEAWDQAGTDERCDYVDNVEVPVPDEVRGLGRLGGDE